MKPGTHGAAWRPAGLLAAALLASCLTTAGQPVRCLAASIIEGKIAYRGNPLAGAVVSLYVNISGGFQGKPDYAAGPTKEDGLFKIEVPKGSYYLIARKSVKEVSEKLAPGDLYAYYGGNPVVAGVDETLNIGINCNEIVDVGAPRLPGGTGIKGYVFADGKPLEKARVTLYQDGESIFRGMGYASMLTARDGAFIFNLESGTYYVVARKRSGEDKFGPLAVGDLFAYAQDNPVEVKNGVFTVISMNTVAKLAKAKAGAELTLGGTAKAADTTLQGKVVDSTGKSVAGLYVCAYRDSMMTAKPDFISKLTGADGAYEVRFFEGGQYFIAARSVLGGPVEKGGWLGSYAGSEDHSLTLKTGEKMQGIDITVAQVD